MAKHFITIHTKKKTPHGVCGEESRENWPIYNITVLVGKRHFWNDNPMVMKWMASKLSRYIFNWLQTEHKCQNSITMILYDCWSVQFHIPIYFLCKCLLRCKEASICWSSVLLVPCTGKIHCKSKGEMNAISAKFSEYFNVVKHILILSNRVMFPKVKFQCEINPIQWMFSIYSC